MSRSTSHLSAGVAVLSRRHLAICLTLCAVWLNPADATDWWLNAAGTGQFPTIQAALSSAQVVNGDVITLDNGIYVGPGNRDVNFLGKNVTVRSTNPQFAEDVVIECQGGPGNPHRGFIFNSGETAGAKLLGISIRHGYVENADGGGIWIGSASPTIDYCDVSFCVASEGNGGGIACTGPGNPTIIRCDVFDNTSGGSTAKNGGGIYTTGNAPAVLQLLNLGRNHAVFTGDGVGGNGGGMCCTNAYISDSDLADNVADGHGGGIDATGCSCVSLNLLNNRAVGPGGGLYGSLLITASLISGNTGLSGGGAAVTAATMTDCVLVGNLSTQGNGGGVSASANSTLQSCTISGNRAVSGGGFAGADTYLDRTIVWGNCASTQGHEMDSGNSVTLECCCVDVSGMIGVVGVVGPLIVTDPLFCGPLPCSQAPIRGGVYTVDSLSPCLPANNACLSQIGALGQGCAVSTVEGNEIVLRDDLRAPAVSRGSIDIEYSIAIAGLARISVYDVGGRRLATLVDESLAAGEHHVNWAGRDEMVGRVPWGVYFLRLTTRAGVLSRRIVHLGE